MQINRDKAQAFIKLIDSMSKAAAINILPKDYDSAILARHTAQEIAEALQPLIDYEQPPLKLIKR